MLPSGEDVKRALRTRHKTHEPTQNTKACVTESGKYDIASVWFCVFRVNLLFYYET